jgi:lysophospholipase L1-like esterase
VVTWAETHPATTSVVSPALQQVLLAGYAARYNNPQVFPVMTAPPTISQSTTLPAGLTNAYVWNTAKGGAFSILGGVVEPLVYAACIKSNTVSGARYDTIGRVEFVTDAPVVSFGVWDSSPQADYRWIVDGLFVSKAYYKNTGAYGAAGEIRYVTLDFTSVGGRAMRHIVMEFNIGFYSVNVAPTATVSKVGKIPLKVAVVGDSFNTTGAPTTFEGFTPFLGDILGIQNMIGLGVPTTGYLGGTGQLPFEQRIMDIQYVNPDVLFITGGYNDSGFLPADVTKAVKSYIKAIRAIYPGLPIVAFGDFGGNRSADPAWIGANAAIDSAYADLILTDANLYYVKCMSDPTGGWMTGSGNVSNLKNDGNSDIYILNDDTHPNPVGKMYLALRMADAILALTP